jgi:hypothetical protein
MVPHDSNTSSFLAHLVAADVGVAAGYRHAPKYVTSDEPLELTGSLLKWYLLSAADRPVPDSIARLARAQLATSSLEARGMGFVVLHRCGDDFYFLLINTWRNENELWETVWYKNGDAMAEFSLFPREESHKPTFCVWELAAVWHEVGAWNRFLSSSRDEAAAQTWLGDRYVGQA